MPNNDQIWPEIGIFLHLRARPCRLIWCPVVGLVGGFGARAVSRKTPIYFMVQILKKKKSPRNIFENSMSDAMVFPQIGNFKTHGEQGLEVSKDKVGGEDEYFNRDFDVTRLGNECTKIFSKSSKL